MTRVALAILTVWTLLGLSSCHETIHIHPWEEPEVREKVVLTLHIDNDAPHLGAIIDYTVSPAVIIYSDDLPERAYSRSLAAPHAAKGEREISEPLLQRAHSLADAFEEVAPYALDGDRWELHLKYEVYAATAEEVSRGLVTPILRRDVAYRADTCRPAHDVELEVPSGPVTVVAVAYIVPAGTDGDWFFRTTPLYTLVCNEDKRQGEHDNVYRDCFAVGQEFRVEPTGIDGNVQHLSATLTRPQGRYMVLADDYETYLGLAGTGLGNATAHIHYPTYINAAYSVLSRRPIASSFDFGYDFAPSLVYADGFPYVRLGDDWSFVSGERSNFNVNISVRDKDDGHTISHNPGILVPVFPGRVTLVVGHWLTETSEGGGVSVDPDFTDEIVIHF